MMRGRDHWAVAVRQPDQSLHVEAHQVGSIAKRFPILAKPGLRGVIALGQALSIGLKALTISANHAVEDEQRLTKGQMAASMVLAFALFTLVFIVGPYIGFRAVRKDVPSSLVRNLLEGVARVVLFLLYLAVIGDGPDDPGVHGVRLAWPRRRDPVPDRGYPDHRRVVLRAVAAGCPVHPVEDHACAHGAGPLAPEDHHTPPGQGSDRGGHQGVRRGAAAGGDALLGVKFLRSFLELARGRATVISPGPLELANRSDLGRGDSRT